MEVSIVTSAACMHACVCVASLVVVDVHIKGSCSSEFYTRHG